MTVLVLLLAGLWSSAASPVYRQPVYVIIGQPMVTYKHEVTTPYFLPQALPETSLTLQTSYPEEEVSHKEPSTYAITSKPETVIKSNKPESPYINTERNPLLEAQAPTVSVSVAVSEPVIDTLNVVEDESYTGRLPVVDTLFVDQTGATGPEAYFTDDSPDNRGPETSAMNIHPVPEAAAVVGSKPFVSKTSSLLETSAIVTQEADAVKIASLAADISTSAAPIDSLTFSVVQPMSSEKADIPAEVSPSPVVDTMSATKAEALVVEDVLPVAELSSDVKSSAPVVKESPVVSPVPIVKASPPVVVSVPVVKASPLVEVSAPVTVEASSPLLVVDAPEPMMAPEPPMPSVGTPFKGGQFHAQDEAGQYTFGHWGGPNTRVETKDSFGRTTGSFAYVNPDGDVQVRKYASAPGSGFRVAASDLPVDTPEVAWVKAALTQTATDAQFLVGQPVINTA